MATIAPATIAPDHTQAATSSYMQTQADIGRHMQTHVDRQADTGRHRQTHADTQADTDRHIQTQ